MKDYLPRRRTCAAVLIAAAAMTSISCGDDQSPVLAEGTIEISTLTQGDDFDPNGYLWSVDNSQGEIIGHEETVWVDALEAGDYEVSLAGMAENCTVPEETNPQTVTVNAADTVAVLFNISCVPLDPDDGGGGGDLLRMRP